MDTVQSMRVFVRVAQRTGFAAAARDLRLSTAAVTKHVASLEALVGARLLDRTTRSVRLTEAGQIYLDRCLECLHSFDDAHTAVQELSSAPRGHLRITAPIDFGRHLGPILAQFQERNPAVDVDVQLSNRVVDLVNEGFDVGIRVALSLDAQYVARHVASSRAALWGSPSYLRAHGRPRTPEDLAGHRHLIFSEPVPLREWPFERDGKRTVVTLPVGMVTNHGETLLETACAGGGLAVIPSFGAADAWAAGRIEPVLTEWKIIVARIYAVYPHRRLLSPKVRAFVEALREAYGDDPTRDPWWERAEAARTARATRRAKR